MIQRIRRSFRKKKASVCINCGHTSRDCYHKEYENIKDLAQSKADHLKWLDLDHQQLNNGAVPNNILLSRQRQLLGQQQRPHSVYNEYTNLPFQQIESQVRLETLKGQVRKKNHCLIILGIGIASAV